MMYLSQDMEIQEFKHDPESNFDCLVHQVEEQSEFCDVTVRAGDWVSKEILPCIF
jgi:hypothetical protein